MLTIDFAARNLAPTKHPMPINTALKVAFIEAGRRQIEVAGDIGMDESKLSKIVNGHLEPTLEEAKAIAKALRRPVDHLFPEVAA